MKICSKCKNQKALDRFCINDYGRHISQCKDCQADYQLKRYSRMKELKDNLNLSQAKTSFSNENSERKCKDFFFYA